MRAVVFGLLLLFAASLFAAAPKVRSEKPLKVLFIGNSLTADVPDMVAALAEASGGRKIRCTAQIQAAATLESHADDCATINAIRGKAWDIVVLQEQTNRAIHNAQAMLAAARSLDAEIGRRGAQTILFLPWARKDKPETQRTLNRAYIDAAKELEADIAPVGPAWTAALAADADRVLYAKDRVHANASGAYLAACVLYGVLLDQSPVGLPGEIRKGDKTLSSLSLDESCKLQKIAWKMVRQSRDKPAKAKWAWEAGD